MARAPFQVLVLPWRRDGDGAVTFALFRRADDGAWQGIAGGGEDDETPLEAARREAFEEAGIPVSCPYLPLDTTASIQASLFPGGQHWGAGVYVIPEHAFGVDVGGHELCIGREHGAMAWLPYAAARARLRYDSNRTALWELNQRIHGRGARDGGA